MSYQYALINKETLIHICDSKQVTKEYIVSKTNLNTGKWEQWIDLNDALLPTIRQAKAIASCLHIPFAALYMNASDIPPKALPKVRNMRTLYGSQANDDSALNIAMIDILLERDFFISICKDLGMAYERFAPSVPTTNDAKSWADAIRKYFSLDIEDQYKCASTRKYYLYLREKIEQRGVFIHCFRDVPVDDTRGFAISESVLPIIGINAEDRSPAKAFTIIHELVHLYKRESSMCNEMFNARTTQAEEIFCNAVAGELLVPERALRIILKNNSYTSPFTRDDIGAIANRFSVSREVVIRRLLDTGEIDNAEYQTYSNEFRLEIEKEREEQRIQRQNGIPSSFRKSVSRDAIDRTSTAVCNALYHGFQEEMFSKRDIAHHLGIAQRHVDGFLSEVSKWNR